MQKESELIVDPWTTHWRIEDYSKLFRVFGIESIENILHKFPVKHRYIRRKIIFGHRDLERVLDAIHKGGDYAVMSGIKPTGDFHLGCKMTAEEIIFFQSLSRKAKVFYCIADIEAFADNGIPFTESSKIAISNVADLLALGLDPDRAYIYKQSEEHRVLRLAAVFSRGVTYNMMHALYGEKTFGHYISALTQAGDILMPQLPDFNGPKPIVVPVGADQDPHIRLTRDLANKYKALYNFIPPSATYHRLMRSLSTGKDKMSKRDPMGYLLLTDSVKSAEMKIMRSFTGGQPTVELQKKLGGKPDKCPVYEMYLFHFMESDNGVKKVYEECVNGKRICGDCKIELCDYVVKFLENHQAKREKLMDIARSLL